MSTPAAPRAFFWLDPPERAMKRLPMLLAAGTLLAATASTLAAADVRVGFYATPAYYPYGPRYYVPYAPRYYYPRPYYAYPRSSRARCTRMRTTRRRRS